MIQIYHNPRCTKSRQGLAVLEEAHVSFEIIKYLDTPPSKKELREILKKLNKQPIDLVRTKEDIWIKNFRGKDLSDNDIIEAMVTYPKLIERPIVINGDIAVIGRPTEMINEII